MGYIIFSSRNMHFRFILTALCRRFRQMLQRRESNLFLKYPGKLKILMEPLMKETPIATSQYKKRKMETWKTVQVHGVKSRKFYKQRY